MRTQSEYQVTLSGWNRENIADLLSLLRQIKSELPEGDRLEDVVDLTELPTGEFPAHLSELERHTDYPIWSWDNAGRCLVGSDFAIENGADILNSYK